IEDRRLRGDLGQHVNQDHAFWAEGRGHREPWGKPIGRPAENVLRRGTFEPTAFVSDLGGQFVGQNKPLLVGGSLRALNSSVLRPRRDNWQRPIEARQRLWKIKDCGSPGHHLSPIAANQQDVLRMLLMLLTKVNNWMLLAIFHRQNAVCGCNL